MQNLFLFFLYCLGSGCDPDRECKIRVEPGRHSRAYITNKTTNGGKLCDSVPVLSCLAIDYRRCLLRTI